jgi:hypothetical protein
LRSVGDVGELAERLFKLYQRHHSSSSSSALELSPEPRLDERAVPAKVRDYLYVDRDRVRMYFKQFGDGSLLRPKRRSTHQQLEAVAPSCDLPATWRNCAHRRRVMMNTREQHDSSKRACSHERQLFRDDTWSLCRACGPLLFGFQIPIQGTCRPLGPTWERLSTWWNHFGTLGRSQRYGRDVPRSKPLRTS